MMTDNDVAALIEAAGSRGDTVRKKALELGLIEAPAAPEAKEESQPKRMTSREPGPNVVVEGADAETEDDDES